MRNVIASIIITILPLSASASCFDAPMWRGEPLGASYIVSQKLAHAAPKRIALLEALFASEKATAEKRNKLIRSLTGHALRYAPVDRAAKGKQWREGDIADMVEHLNEALAKHPRISEQLAELYWLNGCLTEALSQLEQAERVNVSTAYMLIAATDTSAMLPFLETHDLLEPGGLLLATAAQMLPGPKHAAQALSQLENELQKEQGSHYLIPVVQLLLDRGTISKITELPAPDWQNVEEASSYLQQLRAFAILSALNGDCMIGHAARRDLLRLDLSLNQFSLIGLQAVNTYCASPQ